MSDMSARSLHTRIGTLAWDREFTAGNTPVSAGPATQLGKRTLSLS